MTGVHNEFMPTSVRACALWFLALALAAHAAADTYLNVDVCQLMANPDSFDNKLITVRVRIVIGIEDFEMAASDCQTLAANGIWLEYARGLKQPTTWCCGDLRSSDPLAIKMDKNFRRLDHCLRARHNGEPMYDVTATLAGRFDSAPTAVCPDGKNLCPKEGGFGHFGAYTTRLVIESATDVSAVKHTKP